MVFRAVAVVLGKVCAANLLQMVVFGEMVATRRMAARANHANRMSRIITNSIAGLDAARL